MGNENRARVVRLGNRFGIEFGGFQRTATDELSGCAPSVDTRRVGVAHRIQEGDEVALDETRKGVTR